MKDLYIYIFAYTTCKFDGPVPRWAVTSGASLHWQEGKVKGW